MQFPNPQSPSSLVPWEPSDKLIAPSHDNTKLVLTDSRMKNVAAILCLSFLLPNYISITTKFVTSSIANAIRPPNDAGPNPACLWLNLWPRCPEFLRLSRWRIAIALVEIRIILLTAILVGLEHKFLIRLNHKSVISGDWLQLSCMKYFSWKPLPAF